MFCHLFYEVGGTSACNSVGLPLSNPRAPMFRSPLPSPPSTLHRPLHFPVRVPTGNGFLLIVDFLSPGHPQFQLSHPMSNIEPKRHQSQTLLHYLACEPIDFLFVQQKLTRPDRIMGVIASGIVGGNMAVMEPQLAILGPGIGVTQVDLAFPDGFDLRTPEDNPSFKAFLNKIVVVSFAINGDYVGALRHREILAPGRMASNVGRTY
jgi:hypothetical protein